MEDKKLDELKEEQLDKVAGGSITRPSQMTSEELEMVKSGKCPKCGGDIEKSPFGFANCWSCGVTYLV